MNTCYLCNTKENLSIKSQRKSTGYKLMICRECRRTIQGKQVNKPTPYIKALTLKEKQQLWNEQAKANHRKIVEIYGGR